MLNTNDASSAISLEGVSKVFPGTAAPAVTDLSIDIPAGQIVALVGPSGCGKTTTLKMINRLIEPTEGSITVLGAAQDALPAHELRRNIGYVIQQVGLFPHRTIRSNIGVVPELLGWAKADIAKRADELVDLVGLDPDILDRYPAALSGGQQQRVGVARALAADPPILLMDEPYSAVDPVVREHLQGELLALQSKVHKTIVIVTHDIDEAIKLANRVAILNVGGVLEQFATPEELLRNPASAFVAEFLGRERGLRRLALMTVSDIETISGPQLSSLDPAHEAVALMKASFTTWVALVDNERLLGWVSAGDVELGGTQALSELPLQPFVARVSPSTPLREALDVVVTSRSRLAAVVDSDNVFHGFISIDQLAEGLTS